MLATVLQKKREAEFEEKVTLTWLGELYHRTEKLKPLKECLEDLKPQEQQGMSDEEMKAMVLMLNAKFSGTVEEGNTETET